MWFLWVFFSYWEIIWNVSKRGGWQFTKHCLWTMLSVLEKFIWFHLMDQFRLHQNFWNLFANSVSTVARGSLAQHFNKLRILLSSIKIAALRSKLCPLWSIGLKFEPVNHVKWSILPTKFYRFTNHTLHFSFRFDIFVLPHVQRLILFRLQVAVKLVLDLTKFEWRFLRNVTRNAKKINESKFVACYI